MSDTPTIKVSLDCGETYVPAPNGVKIICENVPLVVDGEDQLGIAEITYSSEGRIMDVYGTRAEPLDTHVGTTAVDWESIISGVIQEDTSDE